MGEPAEVLPPMIAEVLPEPEAKPKRIPGIPWTSESARQARLKAIENQKRKKAEAEEIARVVGLRPQALALERAEMLSKEITRTCEVLSGELDGRVRAQLQTSLSRLLDQERILRGIPNPGSYRPTKPKNPQEQTSAQPID